MRAARVRVLRPVLVGGIGLMVILIYLANPALDYGTYISAYANQGIATISRRKLQSMPKFEDKTIHSPERYPINFELTGYLFNENGRSHYVKMPLTSCLTHSFSPYIEREAARRFVDPPHSNVFFANSPAVQWFRGELVLVSRIWLDRERYEPKNDWPENHFTDNVLYTQKFDRHMRPINNGSIMGIMTPKQWWVGDGPIEPRLVRVRDKLYVTFNTAMAFKYHLYMDYTIIYDYEQQLPIIPKIKGGTPMVNASEKDDMPRDKHWMALIQNDELYFVHNLDPLRVMKCTSKGLCEFVVNDVDRKLIFHDTISHLRGGTPFELYEWPYYISVAHVMMYKKSNGHRFYTANIVVLCVEPYRIVYVSDDLKVHPEVYRNAPMVRPRWIDDGFIFPVGIIMENKDWMTLGVHVNDHSSVLLRFKGMRALMSKIIRLDREQKAQRGPPPTYLQKHVHDSLANITKMEFQHYYRH